MHDDFRSLYAYNRWADDRVLDACRQLSQEQYTQEFSGGWPSVRATLVHLAGATDAWARRLQGETITALATEDELPTAADAARVLSGAHDAFDRLLPELTRPERLNTIWSYLNLKGQKKSLPLWGVLRHVVNHGSYHRGQLASKLRRHGLELPSTDLVFWAIEQTPQ